MLIAVLNKLFLLNTLLKKSEVQYSTWTETTLFTTPVISESMLQEDERRFSTSQVVEPVKTPVVEQKV